MIKFTSRMFAFCALLVLPVAAQAQVINGLKANPRVFNDYPGSSLTISNSNTIPGTVTIDDRNMVNDTGNGANRHDVLLSADNGATAFTFNPNQEWFMQGSVTLTDGSNAPRKETGVRINDPVTGDTLLIVNSDGEIVAFGGGASFYNFRGPPFNEPNYIPGQTILLGMHYRPGSPTTTGATPATLEYYINRGSGIESSGPLPYSNLEGGPLSYQVGLYAQGGSNNNAADFFHSAWTGVTGGIIVPEPVGIGMAGLAGMTLLARRRK